VHATVGTDLAQRPIWRSISPQPPPQPLADALFSLLRIDDAVIQAEDMYQMLSMPSGKRECLANVVNQMRATAALPKGQR